MSDEQEQLVEAFASLLAKHSTPDAVRAAEPVGFDAGLWGRLVDLGVVPMAVPEASGGWGASLEDLALVAERVGRAVAPSPVVEAQVVARLLARLETDNAVEALAPHLEGSRLVTLALHPARGPLAKLVPAGAVADDVVVLVGDRLLLVAAGGVSPVANLGAMPLADVDVTGDAIELAAGSSAIAAFESSIDEWLALTAAALVGIGARSLEIGVDYVKERRAFGAPIGSFQAISHRLADSAAAIDGARLLALEAAWACDEDRDRFGELASMSFAFASEAAKDASYRSLHFHGGYGFMMEYDIQLLYRRARAWSSVFADPSRVYERAADKRYGPVRG